MLSTLLSQQNRKQEPVNNNLPAVPYKKSWQISSEMTYKAGPINLKLMISLTNIFKNSKK